MNIYEEIKNRNSNNLTRTAMEFRQNNSLQRTYDYKELLTETLQFEEVLKKSKVSPGYRIAIIAESSPQWCIAYLALQKINATAVLLDASLERHEILSLLSQSDVSGIITNSNTLEKLGVLKATPVFNIMNNLELFSGYDSDTCYETNTKGDSDISSIIFSSGTTKTACGIMHSHDGLILSSEGCLVSNHLSQDDRFLAILPNSHIYGLICQVIGPLLQGGTTCFLGSLTPTELLGAFENFKPTVLPAVPKVYELLKNQIMQKINSDQTTNSLFKKTFPICLNIRKNTGINIGKALFKSIHKGFGGQIKILCSAGAPLNAKTAEFYYGTGFNVLITYGATETGIPTIGNRHKNITTSSCGKPYPNIEVKIDETGQLLIRSPFGMLGYFNDPKTTEEAYDSAGWFLSGDLARIDSKGNVCIEGRCKDNIVLSTGKKVAPDDIELAYAGILGVKELAICGIPVSDTGYDEVHAFIVLEDSTCTSAIIDLKERSILLSQNMKLSDIHIVENIPKTSLMKPKRYLLKKSIMVAKPTPITAPSREPSINIPETITNIIQRISHASLSDVKLDTKMFVELNIDSLGTLELACEIEDNCGVKVSPLLRKDMTVLELIKLVESPPKGMSSISFNILPRLKSKFDYFAFKFARNILCGIYKVKITNDSVLPSNSGYIVCANHVSNFDYLYLTLNFERERFSTFCCIAKKELLKNNFVSKWIAKIAGMIPIDREGIVYESMFSIQQQLKKKWGVLIHPEGTRSLDGNIGTFKKGAAILAIEADVPVFPAYIRGGYEIFPRTKKIPNFFNWKKFKKYQVDVIYGEPILPSGLNADELMSKIEGSVRMLANPTNKKQ